MSNTAQVEPTEEQMKTVFDVIDGHWMDGPSEIMRQVARLLAEREAKLREGPCAGCDKVNAAYAAVVRDVEQSELENMKLRARVAALESEARIAWADCHDGSCEACAKCVDQAKHQRDFATAHVAELENSLAACRGTLFADDRYNEAREAQHILDIKVATSLLGELLEQYREFGGIREATHAKAKTEYARLAHYDDAK